VIVVRYADDLIVGFEREDDARRFQHAMQARLEGFALKLHPDKTRLIEFGRHAAALRSSRDLAKPETFDFSGSRTSVDGPARAGSSSRGSPGPTAGVPSSRRSTSSFGGGCISPSRSRGRG